MWDLIAYLDQETVDFINSKGGLKAIVISHPHYYTTHLDWAKTFDCPVYLSAEDEEWVCREDGEGRRKLIEGEVEQIVEDVKAIKVGGHFPGSLVLLWEGKLFIADSFLITPVSFEHDFVEVCGMTGADFDAERALSCGQTSWDEFVRFHVFVSEYDTTSTVGVAEDVASFEEARF